MILSSPRSKEQRRPGSSRTSQTRLTDKAYRSKDSICIQVVPASLQIHLLMGSVRDREVLQP